MPSSTRRLRRPIPKYFIDRDLGRYVFANVLKEAGLRVEVHDEHFSPDTPLDPKCGCGMQMADCTLGRARALEPLFKGRTS